MDTKSCLIIAGEKSGEDHALTFLPRLISENPQINFFGVGGERLEKLGVELIYHVRDFSGLGFTEVFTKIPFYYRAFDRLVEEVHKRQCKTAILIDFQTFNLKLAKKLESQGVKVLYYVAPQAWVWKPWRARVIQKCVHTLFTILPFEKEWFSKRGVTKIKSVIHPLMIEHGPKLLPMTKSLNTASRLNILLLPGSRNNEVSKLLPIFLDTKIILEKKYPHAKFGIVTSDSVNVENYQNMNTGKVDKVWNSDQLSEALEWADLSMAASGTVTLTTGLFQVPTVVCYQVSLLSQLIIKFLVPYKGPISLTNIVHGEMIFPELVQKQVNPENICLHLDKWIDNNNGDQLVKKLAQTKTLLTGDQIDIPDYMARVIND